MTRENLKPTSMVGKALWRRVDSGSTISDAYWSTVGEAALYVNPVTGIPLLAWEAGDALGSEDWDRLGLSLAGLGMHMHALHATVKTAGTVRIGRWMSESESAGPRGPAGITEKISRQMKARGWTSEQITEAIQSGKQFPAVNKATGNPAVRCVHPRTGQSVVVDSVTNEVVHVGGPGFKYGPGSGDIK